MTTPLLSDLREPPIVGRYYMVPVIDYPHHFKDGEWPTLGPLHHDRGEVDFPHLHFHVDPRFLTARQVRICEASKRWMMDWSLETDVAAFPLCRTDINIPRRPRLAKRRCRASSWTYSPLNSPKWLPALEQRYGAIVAPIRAKGDRLLCPHRKVDLSSLPPDADGIVTCPLHGLRVQCGAAL